MDYREQETAMRWSFAALQELCAVSRGRRPYRTLNELILTCAQAARQAGRDTVLLGDVLAACDAQRPAPELPPQREVAP